MPDAAFRVVTNDEDQHSIWPAGRPIPPGWHDVGFTGTRQDCLTHIDAAWTDMRPRSLRVADHQPAPALRPDRSVRVTSRRLLW